MVNSQLLKLADWRWRLNNLYSIVDKRGQLIRFKENGIQKRINDSTALRKRILKYRQGGVSTNEILKACDDVFFRRNRTACILAHENDGLETLFDMVRSAYKFLRPDLRLTLGKGGGSKYEMVFPDLNSKIYADLEVRGGTINRLHISEAAFAQPKRIKATLEAVPVNGIVTYETTPNGMGNHFYRDWVNRADNCEKMFFPWYVDKQYQIDADIGELTPDELVFCEKAKALYGVSITPGQIAFRRFKQNDLKDLFSQEYPEDDITCFLASGGSPFDLTAIQQMINSAPEPLREEGNLTTYRSFVPGRFYVVGCDAAEGVRRDYSVAVMLDAASLEVVAIYRSNRVKPGEFAKAIMDMCQKFQKGSSAWPLVAVERNNHGHAVLLALDNILNYPNLYKDRNDDMLGWKTNMISRPVMIDAFIEAVEEKQLKLNAKAILYECLTLIDNGGKIEAEDGENDDAVIATAIALQVVIKHGRFDLYDNIAEKILV